MAPACWLDRVPAGWDALLAADPNATAAHRPDLWAALAAAVPGLRPGVIAVERDGALVGGAPLVIERRAGLEWLHAMPWLLPGAPLAAPGRHDEVDAAVAEALATLQRERGVVGGAWVLYRPDGPEAAPPSVARPSGETRRLASALVHLADGPEAAFRRADRKTRQAVARAAAAGLAFAEEPAAVAAAYALHARQARGWRGHRALPLELSRRLLAAPAPPGLDGPPARLFTVRDARGLLCAALALDHPRDVLVWWSGAHPEARPRGAFAFLLWSIVAWAAARGRARVNLGASAGLDPVAAFKDALGARPHAYAVRWLDARHAGARGRLVGALQARLRRGRARGVPA
uniref:GNAT family N-acetyltransferase n=1 Tax=Eiseniibacteriota bacterium TaxID=2212470 RepID=A0A832I441_UNCEI